MFGIMFGMFSLKFTLIGQINGFSQKGVDTQIFVYHLRSQCTPLSSVDQFPDPRHVVFTVAVITPVIT